MKPQAKAAQIGQPQTTPMASKVKVKHGAWSPAAGSAWNPLKKWPPNEACWCGSGKKAKKCHLPTVSQCLSLDACKGLQAMMDRGLLGRGIIRQTFIKEAERREDLSAAHTGPEELRKGTE